MSPGAPLEAPLFRHLTADLREAPEGALDDPEGVERALERLFDAMGVAVRERGARRFEPQGISVTMQGPRVLAVVHTWPEHRSATLDVWSDCEGAEAAVGDWARGFGRPR